MQPKTAAQVKTADALGGIDEQAESHQQRPKPKLPVRERGSAGHRELSVAGFAFEQATRPIGVDGRAAGGGLARLRVARAWWGAARARAVRRRGAAERSRQWRRRPSRAARRGGYPRRSLPGGTPRSR